MTTRLTIPAFALGLLLSMQTAADQPTSLGEAWSVEQSDITLDTRTFYFDRSFDLPDTDDSEALTAGGILKYASGHYRGTGFGLAYYGSLSLFGIVDREKGTGTALLQSDGDDINLLGEAYLEYDNGTHLAKIGRQRLTGPIASDHDIRLLPTAYEAAIYRYRGAGGTDVELGYINAYTGLGSSLGDFEEPVEDWGTDGLGYILVESDLDLVALRGQFVDTLDNSGTYDSYGYIDAKADIPAGTDAYVSGQFGYTGYEVEDSSTAYGLKAGVSLGMFDIALLTNAIRDNIYQVVEGGPLYSDWQQGYGTREPSDSLGIQVTLRPVERARILLGYVDVESRDGDAFNTDTYGEFNLDARYDFSDDMALRLRYSNKDQDENSDREDREDFRVIFYYSF